ncbi:MAG: hypothetical protein JWN64_478 [Parcubacteria group bacterium]|nr:hypothetical protein [Parcubacteria group bacterium]
MVLKFFNREKDYSWKELERITAKVEGQWTWPIAAMIWLSESGYEVVDIELFDYEKFSLEGKGYLQEMFGNEIAEAQDKHTSLEQEQKLSKKLLKYVDVRVRIPDLSDLKKFIDDGYLVICNINSARLKDVEGYLPHSVVVWGHEDETLLLHNPGLPPAENQRVSMDEFERAWAFPNESGKNILAVRQK